jgi:hypothetical protein
MNTTVKLCTFLSILITLNSCALKEVVIKSKEIKPLQNFEKHTPSTKAQGSLNILNFSDQREDKKSIGIAATGMLNIPAPLRIDVPINEYIKEEFTNELGRRGIEVAAQTKYSMTGEIKKLWITENADGISFESSKCDMVVAFNIVNSKTKQPVYHGTITVFVMGTNSIWDTTDSDGPVLKACVNGLAEQFIKHSDIQKILNFTFH